MPQVDIHKMSSEELVNWLQSGPVPEAADFVREHSITGEEFYTQISFDLINQCSKDDRRRAILLDHILSVTEKHRERMHAECSKVENFDDFSLLPAVIAERQTCLALVDLREEREWDNILELLPSQLETARDIVKSIRETGQPVILCYPPGFGKTTLLRGLTRIVSDKRSTSLKFLAKADCAILSSDHAA
eukprot:361183_1